MNISAVVFAILTSVFLYGGLAVCIRIALMKNRDTVETSE